MVIKSISGKVVFTNPDIGSIQDADLRNADLRNADLSDADLRYANLRSADLRYADLSDADLRYANLQGADLQGADLQGADFSGAYLSDANLSVADLRNADLRYANLSDADLRNANLRNADLRYANLSDADLRGADLQGAKLPLFWIIPEEGAFVGWKKCEGYIVKLLIPSGVKRTCSLVGRKCRAENAFVLEIQHVDRTSADIRSIQSERGGIYTIDSITKSDSYNDDIRIECSNGIHFFITRQEAVEYGP